MKTAIIAVALLSGTAALAQDIYTPPADPMTPVDATMPDSTLPDQVTPQMTTTMTPTGQVSEPSNANPEHDARGIAVISDAAMVPAGYNGTPGTSSARAARWWIRPIPPRSASRRRRPTHPIRPARAQSPTIACRPTNAGGARRGWRAFRPRDNPLTGTLSESAGWGNFRK